MKAAMVMLSAFSTGAFGWEAVHADPPERRDENVLITSVTDDPCCGSGIIAFAVGVSGRTADGERSYFIPFMTQGQRKPRAGERCAIRWQWWRSRAWYWVLAGGGQIWEGRQVSDFSCRRPGPKR